MKTHQEIPPLNDPFREEPEPAELKEALLCPKCGCAPDWDKSFVGGLKMFCCGIDSGWWSTWEKVTAAWDEKVDAAMALVISEDSGDNRKAAGQELIMLNDQAWMDTVIQVIKRLAQIKLQFNQPFTVEDLRRRCKRDGVREPKHHNAWGAAMSTAARQGLIERVGYAPNKLASAHARVVMVWRGKTS